MYLHAGELGLLACAIPRTAGHELQSHKPAQVSNATASAMATAAAICRTWASVRAHGRRMLEDIYDPAWRHRAMDPPPQLPKEAHVRDKHAGVCYVDASI